jgi:pilus assembly protein CpaB
MGRLRGFLWLTAGLVVAALAGVVAFVVLRNAATTQEPGEDIVQAPQVPVVVASQRIQVRSLLTAEDLELRDIPVDAVPETALDQLEEGVGRITLVDLYPGEILLTERLVDPDVIAADGRTALVINDDQVLMAFPASDLMSNVNVLKPGDHVDMLFSYNLPVEEVTQGVSGVGPPGEGGQVAGEGEEQVTFTLLQNVVIAAITGGGEEGGARALLLTLSPQDALVLKWIKDAGGNQDLVLRAPGVEVEFPTDPVHLDYLINRYLLPTGEE